MSKDFEGKAAQTTRGHNPLKSLTPWSLKVARHSSFPLRATMDLRRSTRDVDFHHSGYRSERSQENHAETKSQPHQHLNQLHDAGCRYNRKTAPSLREAQPHDLYGHLGPAEHLFERRKNVWNAKSRVVQQRERLFLSFSN